MIKRFLISLIIGKQASQDVNWFLAKISERLCEDMHHLKYDLNTRVSEDIDCVNELRKYFKE